MNRLSNHVRSNVVAYLALFIALGGTGYAATQLPAGSVGARQIKNGVIQPVKLDPSYIDGNVRIWGSVSASGQVLAGGRGYTVQVDNAEAGSYFINPTSPSRVATPRGCAAMATVDTNPTDAPAYATAGVSYTPQFTKAPWDVVVNTYDAEGQHASLPFDFAVIC
jgi:hypothetical protein